jgi:hypothetical protein
MLQKFWGAKEKNEKWKKNDEKKRKVRKKKKKRKKRKRKKWEGNKIKIYRCSSVLFAS